MKKNLFFSVAVIAAAIPIVCKGAFYTTNARNAVLETLRFTCPFNQRDYLFRYFCNCFLIV
jgi:hypothetical protein